MVIPLPIKSHPFVSAWVRSLGLYQFILLLLFSLSFMFSYQHQTMNPPPPSLTCPIATYGHPPYPNTSYLHPHLPPPPPSYPFPTQNPPYPYPTYTPSINHTVAPNQYAVKWPATHFNNTHLSSTILTNKHTQANKHNQTKPPNAPPHPQPRSQVIKRSIFHVGTKTFTLSFNGGRAAPY
jgi:hypothetical protein